MQPCLIGMYAFVASHFLERVTIPAFASMPVES